MGRRHVVIANSNLEVQLLGCLPFVLEIVSLPIGLVVSKGGADKAKKIGRQIQQHTGQTVTGARGVEIRAVGCARRERVEAGRLAPAVIEAVDVVEHGARAEGVGAVNFLNVRTELVRADWTERNRKLAGAPQTRRQTDLGNDRDTVAHRL